MPDTIGKFASYGCIRMFNRHYDLYDRVSVGTVEQYAVLAIERLGDTVKAVVLDVDVEKERISLGIKQVAGDPFATAGKEAAATCARAAS